MKTTINTETGEISTQPLVRSAFNFDAQTNSDEHSTINIEPTMTQQHFKDECDINTIMERFGVTGELPTNIRQPMSADFIEAMDFHEAQNALLEATSSFMELPAQVRAKFENDPAALIQYLEADLDDNGSKDRQEFMDKYGLTKPSATPSETVSPGPVTSSTELVQPAVKPA